jgi:hypothetical protein
LNDSRARNLALALVLALAGACGPEWTGNVSKVPDAANIPNFDWPSRDRPCPPAGAACATEKRSPDPDAVAEGRPLVVERLEVSIDHRGTYRVPLGRATLPNGFHSRTFFRLAEPMPYRAYSIHVEFQPVDPDAPRYTELAIERPLGDEPVEVEAVFVFDVRAFESGATMVIEDLVLE